MSRHRKQQIERGMQAPGPPPGCIRRSSPCSGAFMALRCCSFVLSTAFLHAPVANRQNEGQNGLIFCMATKCSRKISCALSLLWSSPRKAVISLPSTSRLRVSKYSAQAGMRPMISAGSLPVTGVFRKHGIKSSSKRKMSWVGRQAPITCRFCSEAFGVGRAFGNQPFDYGLQAGSLGIKTRISQSSSGVPRMDQ